MFYLLISLQLLWMSVNGHSLSKVQAYDPNSSDVYTVKEDKSTNSIVFSNPKTDQPTLREIVYYHVIERPYGQEPVKEEGPDFDETVRPFTNSHGFPFLESAEKESHSRHSEESSQESGSKDVIQETPAILQPENEIVEIIYYDEDDETVPEDTKYETQDFKPVKTEEVPEVTSFSTALPDTTLHIEQDEDFPVSTPVVEEALEIKAKHARKLLFDRVRERYYSKTETQNDTLPSLERRKRDISMDIPEAPRLGPINYDSFPPYVRSLIQTDDPLPKSRNLSPDSDEDDLDQIKDKMVDMMNNIKSRSVSEDLEEGKPRTYGMNLTEDHGYVWNNMWSQPGVHFNVEVSESLEEHQENQSNDKEEPVNKIDDTLVESKESVEQIPDDDDEEIQLDKSKEPEHDVAEEKDDDDVKPASDLIEDEDTIDMETRKRKDKKKETTVNELLENEQFWKWLTDWTSVYMDVLSDHVKEMIQEEVSSQMKPYEETHKDDNELPHKEDEKQDEKVEVNENGSTNIEPEKDKENAEEIKTSTNVDKIPKEDQKEDLNDEELLKRKRDKDNKNKPNNNSNVDKEKEPTTNIVEENKLKPSEESDHKEHSHIHGQNLYGNSIGSDQVTNIFIFYPNSESDKVMHEIENQTDSKINVFTPNVDERVNVTEDKEVTSLEISDENLNKEINKNEPLVKDIEEKGDVEKDKKDSSQLDIVKEDSNKEDTSSETSDIPKDSSTEEPSTHITELNDNKSTEKMDTVSDAENKKEISDIEHKEDLEDSKGKDDDVIKEVSDDKKSEDEKNDDQNIEDDKKVQDDKNDDQKIEDGKNDTPPNENPDDKKDTEKSDAEPNSEVISENDSE